MKTCKTCSLIKNEETDFYKRDSKSYASECKVCRNKRTALYLWSNPEKADQYAKNNYKKNGHKRIMKNRANVKKYEQEHREWKRKWNRKMYHKHKRKRLAYSKEYKRKRRSTDLLFKLSDRLRNRLREAIRQKKFIKNSPFFKVLGCSVEELKNHIEKQFLEGMSWENYGRGSGKWHLDHITPLSSAKTIEQMYKLSHFSNIQPLWENDNLVKGNKIVVD